MAFFIGLLSISLSFWLISRLLGKGPFQDFRAAACLAVSLMFIQVGTVHLFKPDSLTYMIEGLLPFPQFLVILSGVAEILLGAGLLWSKSRKWSARGLIVLLIMVFPANVNVAVNGLAAPGGLPSEDWYVWSRLLFQPLYILWIYFSSLKSRSSLVSPASYLITAFMLTSFQQAPPSANLVIENIPSNGGTLFIGWYDQEAGFREINQAVFRRQVEVKSQEEIAVLFDQIPSGKYAISLFLDQNGNGELDTNFLGIPKEPYGFSNNIYPAMRAATFSEALFSYPGTKQIRIRLKD